MSDLTMEQRIRTHLDQLFAHAPADSRVREIKQEIYMNTVDRYHDLLAEGKSDELAYEEVIGSIGDIRELLKTLGNGVTDQETIMPPAPHKVRGKSRRKVIREHLDTILWMIMLTLYFIISFHTMAWFITWIMFLITSALQNVMHAIMDYVAVGKQDELYVPSKAEKRMHGNLHGALWLTVTATYFVISFLTMQWHITWVIFLLGVAAQSLLSVIMMNVSHNGDETKGEPQ